MTKYSVYETWELEVNDLCIFTGPIESFLYAKMRHRLVYRVVAKRPQETSYSKNLYTLRPAFDLAGPWGKEGDKPEEVTKLGTSHLVRLDILDLCRLRLDLDNFILERGRELSTGSDEG